MVLVQRERIEQVLVVQRQEQLLSGGLFNLLLQDVLLKSSGDVVISYLKGNTQLFELLQRNAAELSQYRVAGFRIRPQIYKFALNEGEWK